ncbi:AP-4 complex subunit sigma-1 [Portunus trituberculatus]|uniref:AP-4 complex subunit sigma-1 n=1 Tax=Portunus trituberculatus TaxID=210409 RepID=A0A5B7CWL1_PORTR|nr:AP-4 complex subunit sigma-1 [Portunus trituberculatus]
MMHYLLISKDGSVQFSHYFTHSSPSSRPTTEARCHFLEDGPHTLVFRWFGPCMFVVAADHSENELMIYEFLSLYVNALHKYFGKFSEKHILLNIERLHMVLEEMVVAGELLEPSIRNALSPIQIPQMNLMTQQPCLRNEL